ncbi:MAG: hypothetical protein V3S03_08465 [Vicinamibacteria bacterium]
MAEETAIEVESPQRAPASTGRQIGEGVAGAGAVTALLFAFLPEGLLSDVQVGALAAFASASLPVLLTIARNVAFQKGWTETWLKGVLGVLVVVGGLGCAFQGRGYGIELAWALGDASIGCSYSEEGYLEGGQNCIAGGELSPQAAAAAALLLADDGEDLHADVDALELEPE